MASVLMLNSLIHFIESGYFFVCKNEANAGRVGKEKTTANNQTKPS